MLNEIQKEILSNEFIDNLRIKMVVDEAAYEKLCQLLVRLAMELKGKTSVDKELMLTLFSMPNMVRNTFESFSGFENKPETVDRLEEMWIQLDGLITDCLQA